MNALEIKNLTVKLGDQEVLKNISFSIPENTITALIGPNGGGKTVLLKTILGLFPYKGEIKIYGKNHLEMLDIIGYVPQIYSIDPILPLTVFEFLEIVNNDCSKIEEVLKEADIYEIKNKKIGNLSEGQLQRVLFARSILNKPKILLLDEPISGADIIGQRNFFNIIKNLNNKERVTILLTTHEISIVPTFASKVLCLNKFLICDGTFSEVFKEENLARLYQQDVYKDYLK